jgi:hypothetical protein
MLQKIDDPSVIQKVKDFILHEIGPIYLSENKKKSLIKEYWNTKKIPNLELMLLSF